MRGANFFQPGQNRRLPIPELGHREAGLQGAPGGTYKKSVKILRGQPLGQGFGLLLAIGRQDRIIARPTQGLPIWLCVTNQHQFAQAGLIGYYDLGSE